MGFDSFQRAPPSFLYGIPQGRGEMYEQSRPRFSKITGVDVGVLGSEVTAEKRRDTLLNILEVT